MKQPDDSIKKHDSMTIFILKYLIKLILPYKKYLSLISYKWDRIYLERMVKRGLKIGNNVYIGPKVEFDEGYPYLIEIGNNCRISMGCIILAHDATVFRHLGVTRLQPVKILDDSYIGRNVIVLPGVTIGPRAVIATGSIVNRNIGEGKIAAGNPARPYEDYSDMLKKYYENVKGAKIFSVHDIANGLVSPEDIKDAIKENQVAFASEVPEYDPFYVNTDMNYIKKKAHDDVTYVIEMLKQTEDKDK